MELVLAIEGAEGCDDIDVDRMTGQLRRRLLDLDVDDVTPVRSGEVPPGAKPVDAITIGALAVAMGPSVLQAVVDLVRTWAERQDVRRVKLTIDGDSFEGVVTDEEQRRLLDLFVARHAEE